MEILDYIILDAKESEFINTFTIAQDVETEAWKESLLKAILRLSTWNKFMIRQIGNKDILSEKLIDNSKAILLGNLLPAAELLLEVTRLSSNPMVGNQDNVLLRLNDYLLNTTPINSSELVSLHSSIIKGIYTNFSKNPYIILAALAIFDVHVSQVCNLTLQENNRRRVLELYPNIFRPMAIGLNIGFLQKSWDSLLYNYLRSGGLLNAISVKAIEKEHNLRNAQSLIERFNLVFEHSGLIAEIEIDAYSKYCLFEKNLPGHDLAGAIYLKITAPDEMQCYQAEGWLESQGTVQSQFVRKSLFYPEENGAKRFEIGLITKDSDCLVIARLGTHETFALNEWGRLIDFDVFADQILLNHSNVLRTAKRRNQLCVFKTNGSLVEVGKGCTTAEFINKEYFTRSQDILGVLVNGIPEQLGYVLMPNDLVDIVFKEDSRCRFIPMGAFGLVDRHLLKDITANKTTQEEDVLRGKMRITLAVQKHIEPWQFKIDEHQISILLNAMNQLFGHMNLEEVFSYLAYNHEHDDEICQFALQFKIRGRVRLSNGNSLPKIYNWKNTSIAQCCNPKFDDEIIGRIWKGPKNPDHPAYQRFHELKIHKRDCSKVPRIENILEIEWLPSNQHTYGFVVEGLLKDEVGCLGEFLNILYNTNLTMHSVKADAIHFQNQASIVVHATSFTRDELQNAKESLIERYGKTAIRTRNLSVLEVSQLVSMRESNPYIISSATEIEKELPVLFFGREQELSKLIYTLHDSTKRCVLINGYYRVGKTWFLKQFMTQYLKPKRLVVYLSVNHIFLSNNPARDFAYAVFLKTVKALEENKIMSNDLHQRPQDLIDLRIWFEKVSKKTGYDILLLLDEFSVLSDWENDKKIDIDFVRHIRNFIFSAAEVNFVLVFQSSYIHNLIDVGTIFNDEFFNYFRGHHDEEIVLKPFIKDEVVDLLTKPASGNYQFSKNSLDYAHHLCGGVPFIGALLGKEIWNYAHDSNTKKINMKVMREIVGQIENDSSWSAYLNILVNKLYGTDTLLILKTIAELEYIKKTESITQELICDRLNFSSTRVKNALSDLEKANLIEVNKKSFRVCGTLLSTHLATTDFAMKRGRSND